MTPPHDESARPLPSRKKIGPMPPRCLKSSSAWPPSLQACILSAAFWTCALCLWPFGDFPLGDDWAYAWTVRRLQDTGGLEISHWASPTVVSQALWGRLFTVPLGFSHGALRLSTLTLAWLGLLSFRRTLLRLGAGPRASLAGTFGLWLNPLFFVLSFTFMTDVQALAWMLMAGEAYLRGIEAQEPRRLAAASALSAAAYLTRQTGICLPVAASAWMWARGRRRPWPHVCSLAPVFLTVAGHALWSSHNGPTSAFLRYNVFSTLTHLGDPLLLLRDILSRLSGASLYLGLFLAPWTLARLPGTPRSLLPLSTLALLWIACTFWNIQPALGNVLGRYGLGTCTLGSTCAFKAAGIFGRPWFWIAVTGLALTSCACLLQRHGFGGRLWGAPWGAYMGGFLLAFLLSLTGKDYFDRYYLVLFPPLIALLAATKASIPASRIAVISAFMAAWSVLGTWDYLAWNSAKWEGGLRLRAMGIPEHEISAGMDWDATYSYEASMRRLLRDRPAAAIGPFDWRRVQRQRAFVAFAPAFKSPDLERVGEVPYRCPLSFKTERVYLWMEKAAPNPDLPSSRQMHTR